MTDGDRTGKRARFTLINNLHYSGVILFEDENSITIKDKFGVEVCIGKNNLISMEVQE